MHHWKIYIIPVFVLILISRIVASDNLSLLNLAGSNVNYREELKPVSMLFAVYSLPYTTELYDTVRCLLFFDYTISFFSSHWQRSFINSYWIPGFPVGGIDFRLADNVSIQGKFSASLYRRDNVFFTGTSVLYHRSTKRGIISSGIELNHIYGPDHFRLKMFSLFSIFYPGLFYPGLESSRLAFVVNYTSVDYTLSRLFSRRKLEENVLMVAVSVLLIKHDYLKFYLRSGISGWSPFINLTTGMMIP